MTEKQKLLKQLPTLEGGWFKSQSYYGDLDQLLYDAVFYLLGEWVFETRECYGSVCYRHIYTSSEELLKHIDLEKFTYQDDFWVWW